MSESAGAWRRIRNVTRKLFPGKPSAPGNSAAEYFLPAKCMTTLPGDSGEPRMAMDSCPSLGMSGMIYGDLLDGMERVITQFFGYHNLALLRSCRVLELIFSGYAQDMTTNMVQLEPTGPDAEAMSSRINEIQDIAEEKYDISNFICSVLRDYLFWDGGCLIHPIVNGLEPGKTVFDIHNPKHLPKGALKGFHVIEAVNSSVVETDYSTPLSPTFYEPITYNIFGADVSATHFLRVQQTRLPYMLRPVYNFFGVPLAQTLYPYVCAFEEARISLVDIISNHRLLILKTPMAEYLKSGCTDTAGIRARAEEFVDQRDNNGIVLINSEGNEDLIQINTPLSQLADLGSLNFELIAFVAKRPVTKLFGTPPRGLNATGHDDIVFDNQHIHGMKESIIKHAVVSMYEMIQMSEFGEILDGIKYNFRTMSPNTEDEKMSLRNSAATANDIYLRNRIVSRLEVRQQISADPNSGYDNIDPKALPEDDEYDIYDADGGIVTHGQANNQNNSEFSPVNQSRRGSPPGSTKAPDADGGGDVGGAG